MDWVRDNTGISDNDFMRVFKYEPKPSTVIRILRRDEVRLARLDGRGNATTGREGAEAPAY
jgi:hypothetical protein